MRFNETRNLANLGNQLNAIGELMNENPDISQRALLKKLQEKGISISLGTLNKRLKEVTKLTT